MTGPRLAHGDRRSTAGATVLVVDDSRAIRAILRRTLEQEGYRVLEAENGSVGLDIARDAAPDLMLLDVDMPVLDGHATLVQMKADPVLCRVPVLMLTARTGAEDVALGLGQGARDYLRKPCSPIELTARIAGALRQSAQEHTFFEQQHELEELSSHDALTGLGNRRLLDDARQHRLQTLGPRVRVGIAIVDLDLFKNVNDTYGHVTGDAVLRAAAGRLEAAVPPDALTIRWGGEEFAVVRTGEEAADIADTADRVRMALGDSPFAVDTEVPLRVTASVGVASGLLVNFDDVMALADAALYRAKSAGRNRVEVDSEAHDGD